MEPDQTLVYCEPTPQGNREFHVSAACAIREQRRIGLAHQYAYASDAQALDDFCAVHWAAVVEHMPKAGGKQ